MIKYPDAAQPTVMNHDFGSRPTASIQRSAFNLSHGYKGTLPVAGILYPFFWFHELPGDTPIMKDCKILARLATPIFPTMDNLYASTFFFRVPYRLVLPTVDEVLGANRSPNADPYIPPPANTHVFPRQISDGFNNASLSLADFFGIPVVDGSGAAVVGLPYSVMRFRAYYEIWNVKFRDENQQIVQSYPTSEADDTQLYALLPRGKRYDYYTSGLPWPQKSSPVTIPLAGTAPVTGIGHGTHFQDPGGANDVILTRRLFTGGGSADDEWLGAGGAGTAAPVSGAANSVPADLISTITGTADMTAVSAMTLTQFFQGYALQMLYQADARGGTRNLQEIIFGHFNVQSPDMRMQVPEYLGGGRVPVNISPIANTSDTDTGDLAAMGISLGSAGQWSTSGTEHSVILGLICFDADLTYQQGLEREESVRSRFDLFWPTLANLGEQAVLSKEIYADGSAADDDVFSYMPAWDHLRFKRSNVTGLFRSNVAGSLDAWHYSQDFATRPVLGDAFIKSLPPVGRTVRVPSQPHFLLDAWFNFECVRPIPTYSIPGIQPHF